MDLWLANLPPLTYSPLGNKVLIGETNGFFVLIMEKKHTTKKTGGGGGGGELLGLCVADAFFTIKYI